MSAQERLSAIYTDLYSLGLMRVDSIKDVDRSTIFHTVMATKRIGQSRAPYNPSPTTSYGQTVYETMRTGVEFSTHPFITKQKYYACGDAEKYFARTIRPGISEEGVAPVVVVDREIPVAIIKGLGEATAYALRGSTAGLIERTIALPSRPLDPRFLTQDVPAHKVELHDLGDFSPVRYALTAIPYESIASAPDSHYNTIESFSHEAMLEHAQKLAACARPLARRALSEALSETAYYYEL